MNWIRPERIQLFGSAFGTLRNRRQRKQILLRLNGVYTGNISTAEKRLLNGMKAKTGRIVKEQW
jgi:hypothetical protein